MASNELETLQDQGSNSEDAMSTETKKRRFSRTLVSIIWAGGQLVLSYILGGIPFAFVSLSVGFNSKDAPLLYTAYCSIYLCLSLIIFTPIIKLIRLSWKKALLATLSSSLVFIPISILLMFPIHARKMAEKSRVMQEAATREIHKYEGTVEFTNTAEELKNEVSCEGLGPRCTKNKDHKFLVISLDMKTPYEGTYTINMTIDHKKEGLLGDFFILVGADWETNELYLKPGTHHLEFVLPAETLTKKEVSGPHQIGLAVGLDNDESRKAQEEHPLSPIYYHLFYKQDFYRTKTYNWPDLKVKRDKLRYISHETIFNPTTDKLGTVELNCQILEPGKYKFFTVFEVSLSIQPYTYSTSSTQRKELPQGNQKIEIPIPQIIVSGQKILPAQISKIGVTQIDYCSYQGSSPCYEESLPLL